MKNRKKRSQPALLTRVYLQTNRAQRMSVWMDFRLKNMLFMLDVVYRENETLHDLADKAIQSITLILKQLDASLCNARDELPAVNDDNAAVEYSQPKTIEITCTTPQARIYASLLQNFDQLVQKCDLLWLTGQWNREESRKPVIDWTKEISRTINRCAGHYLPLRAKYIQTQNFLHQSDDAAEQPAESTDHQ